MAESSPWLSMDETRMENILKTWKSKSLNSMPTEKYMIPMKYKRHEEQAKKPGKNDPAKTHDPKPEALPEPKITKIKDSIFCVYLNTELMVFIFATQEQKLINRSKGTFRNIFKSFKDDIKFVVSNNSDHIYVGLEDELHILEFKWQTDKTEEGKAVVYIKDLESAEVKQLPKLKGATYVKEKTVQGTPACLVAVTVDRLLQYSPDNGYKQLRQSKVLFQDPNDKAICQELRNITILPESNTHVYMFGTKEGIVEEATDKVEAGLKKRKCEYLFLAKFSLEESSEATHANFSMIDHVFETGIFSKSKIFQEGPSVFLISLYEEIIVVKYHFQKYVVWDNISLASSKSHEKKGQLILADELVMVYTENGEIFAHNIFFSFKDYKLRYPRIDNFKGNDNDEEILYDALVLEYEEGSFMKVLFYFKETDVFAPNGKVLVPKEDKNMGGDHKEVLNVNILCIQQNSPEQKLGELYKSKKPPQEIFEFVQRFNIAELDRSKCEWSVSEKTEKDIENLLLQIKDNEYIQNELTKILKSMPHDLKFLSRIEKKQIERYKKMLASKLLKNDQDISFEPLKLTEERSLAQTELELDAPTQTSDEKRLRDSNDKRRRNLFTEEEKQQIKQMIRWVMQSIMFLKKLVYSQNFLQFMEYDFIEIGKLKAASLKEEIKLLSCKGYEKRLQYFLNSFKYMILSNFEDIFEFLIEDKNEQEVEEFFINNFPFILPKFQEPSKIFHDKKVAKKYSNQLSKERSRRQTFAIQKDEIKDFQVPKQRQNRSEQCCELWEDKFGDINEVKKIETKQSFQKEIEEEIQVAWKAFNSTDLKEKTKNQKLVLKKCLKEEEAKAQFGMILESFVSESWFVTNKSKQHSIIDKDVDMLKEKMNYLKRIGVFNELIKFFYKKIDKKVYSMAKVDQILENFEQKQLIPQSFQQNILVRREIYDKIKHKYISLELKEFLVMEETEFFNLLFVNCRPMLLKEFKAVYDKAAPGFFREKFSIYLNSDQIVLSEIISFIDEFEGNSCDDIRMDVFVCIKKILKINDKENTSSLVNKLIEKEILNSESVGGSSELIDQAKVVFGCYFDSLFELFGLEYTYEELIEETRQSEYEKCKIIQKILEKYCQEGVKENGQNQQQQEICLFFEQRFGLGEIKAFILSHEGIGPFEFFGTMIYFLDTLRFEISPLVIFDRFIELLLEVEKYEQLVNFIYFYKRIIGKEEGLDDQENIEYEDEILKTQKYILLKQFYEGLSIEERLIQNILKWIKAQYRLALERRRNMPPSYTNYIQYKETFEIISNTFVHVIDELELESADIVREKAFLEMLKNAREIEPKLINYILKERFKGEVEESSEMFEEKSVLLNGLSSFMFMIHILNTIPRDKFEESKLDVIDREIQVMERLYIEFQSASRFSTKAANKEDRFGLVRFFMELAMRLIRDKQFAYCRQVVIKIINNEYYFKDVLFQFMACVNPGNVGSGCSQQEFRRKFNHFIKDFIQTANQRNMVSKFCNFLDEYNIKNFQGVNPTKTEPSEDLHASQKISADKGLFAAVGVRDMSRGRKSTVVQEKEVKTSLLMFGEGDQSVLTKQIFDAMIDSHRVDEAYYFLVRNTLLSVSQANNYFNRSLTYTSFSLISIYVKCLENYLCKEFYPTFTFYRKKHSMLINQYERKDIIKDINIAISRLKEMIADIKFKVKEKVLAHENGKNLIGEFVNKQIVLSASTEGLPKEEDTKPKTEEAETSNLIEELKISQRGIENKLKELQDYYNMFMRENGLDPELQLNEESLTNDSGQDNYVTREISSKQLNLPAQDEVKMEQYIKNSPRFETFDGFSTQFNKKQQDQEQKQKRQIELQKKKSKDSYKFAELQKQANEQLRQTKMINEKYQRLQESILKPLEKKPAKGQISQNQLRQREKEDLQSIKESYKSQTSQKVNQLLETIRARKNKLFERSDARSRFSQIDVDPSEPHSRKSSFENMNNFQPGKASEDRRSPHFERGNMEITGSQGQGHLDSSINLSRKYEVTVHGVDGHAKNIYMPVTMTKQKEQSSRVSMANKPQSQYLLEMEKRRAGSQLTGSAVQMYKSQGLHSKMKPINGLEELVKLFEEKEPQSKQYVQKIAFVKNNLQVGLQITKNIYSTVHNFDVFVRFVGYMLDSNPKYREILEQKAYKIALHSLGFEHKLQLKELFPVQIFTTVCNVSAKEYYKLAYDMMRPCLMKVLAKPDSNVHGLAVLFRFGFGSENAYYYQVYEDYIKVLLKDFTEHNPDQKQVFLLAEKIRSMYNNISAENRQGRFEQLLLQIPSDQRRKNICREILKALERRTEMVTGEKQTDLHELLRKMI